jgi:DNA topoisomerase-1
MNLVIVESPSKARTIKKFLGPDFEVTASSGHIKDLPQKDLGVDVENNFTPSYHFIPNKKKFIESIRKLARQADQVYIATDPDREGEAIAAHVAEVIRETHSSPHRALFFEITRNAVQRAITSSGTIDQRKVDAQIARRVVDRLVGYQVSPFIWKTVAKGLSAGRVQSVALRLVCERETEINGFVPQEYWSIHALFSGAEVETFWAELVRYRDEKVDLPDKSSADAVEAATKKASFEVSAFKKNQTKSKPYAPYTTSTLQQDASRRLSFSSKRTMSLAQKLYEGIELADGETTGLITYMRTDSTRVASEAVNSARGYIRNQIGADFLPEKPRLYSQKKKRTQDAHEAIRPTNVARTPGELKGVLDSSLWKLYDLIWRRFVASQMADTLNEVTTVEIAGDDLLFRAKGQQRLFDGFQKIYPLDNSANQLLPTLPDGFGVGFPMVLKDVDGKQHFTQPPARFTEATLVKALDELGIGRPSTYATIIGTLLDRDYTRSEKRKLIPTKLGETVNLILVELFPKIFEVGFTARMEEQLDLVEEGTPWVDVIGEFYEPFSRTLVEAEEKRRDIKKKVEEVTEEICEKCGRHMVIKWGRRGRFLACSGFPECRNSKSLEPPQESGKKCPKCGQDLLIKEGRFGRFLGCSNYPSCRHVEPVGTGVACPEPECGGELVERSSKKGRFYSCSRYPDCKYRLKSKPEPIPCEECGHPFMTHTGGSGDRDQLVCPKCKSKIKKVPESENVV